MAIRAKSDLGPNPKVKSMTVDPASSAVEGRPVTFTSADEIVGLTTAGGKADGMAMVTAAGGARVQVLVAGGDAIVKAKVGTGGATRGAYAVVVADGLTNAPTLGGGTVAHNIVGRFLQTGVAGDVVGFVFEPWVGLAAT